jgi:hypothetical protein
MIIDLDKTQNTILNLLRSSQRHNMEELIIYLVNNGFFIYPASIENHANFKGGLAHHSLLTTRLLIDKIIKIEELKEKIDTAVICGLLHDVCKADLYDQVQAKNDPPTDKQINYVKNLCRENNVQLNPLWILCKSNCTQILNWFQGKTEVPVFKTEDDIVFRIKPNRTLLLGHGEHSVYRISQFISLTDEEATSIRWHMGCHDMGGDYGEKSYSEAYNTYPITRLLHTSDADASCIEYYNLTGVIE